MSKTPKKSRKIPQTTNFGNNLRFLRKENKLTQGELAKILNISRSKIASYESGAAEPNITLLLLICKFFSIKPKDILQGDLSNPESEKLSPTNNKASFSAENLEQIEKLSKKTEEIDKIIAGYRAFYQMKKELADDQGDQELNNTLDDLLSLMQSTVTNNQTFIKNISQNSDEKDKP